MTKIAKSLSMIILLSGIIFSEINGQDLHYSQFYNSPLNVNPAATGIFNGDKRFMASYRDQWRSVPVPWITFSGSYDQRIKSSSNDGFFSWGALFNYDRQGDSKLNLTNLNLSGSYTRIINSNNLLSFGLLAGFSSRGFNQENLTWDKQWDGVAFDPNIQSGEDFNFDRINFLETGGGIHYRYQQSNRTYLNLGAGVFHFIRPQPNFYQDENLALPMRVALSLEGNFRLASAFDIQLHALQQLQNEYKETVFGALLKLYLNGDKGDETGIHFGLGYRTSEALIPTVALSIGNIYVGFSYDIDTSEFNPVTNNRGGPEFHFRYIIKEVKPLSDFKVCPIY